MRIRVFYVLILLLVMLTLVHLVNSCRCDKDMILRVCQCPLSRRLGQRPLADRFTNMSQEIRNQQIGRTSSQETISQRQGQQVSKSKHDGANSSRPIQEKSKQPKPKRPSKPNYSAFMKFRPPDVPEPTKVESLKSIKLANAQEQVSVHFVAIPEPEVIPEPKVKPEPESETVVKVIADAETSKTTNENPVDSEDAQDRPDEYLSMNQYLLNNDDTGANANGNADASAVENANNGAGVNDGNANPDENVKIPDLTVDEDIPHKMRVKRGRSKRLLLALQRAGAGS